jgi:adenine-specific DNA-methyltransferase
LIYDITTPSGKTISPPSKGWRFSKETMQKKIDSKQIVFNDDETRLIFKIYLKDVKGRVPETIWFGKESWDNKRWKEYFERII